MTSNHPNPLSEKAVAGFANAASYDRHRPSYPSEAVTLLLKAVGVHGFQRSRVIDLAAGTGIFTELLAAREEQFDILAVEPHDEMRAQLTRKALKNVEIADGSSSSIPVEDNSVDAVFAAQAFHWFSNKESLIEIHRVLNPGAALGMIWNVEDYNSPKSYPTSSKWAATLREHIFALDDTIDDHEPRFRHDEWRKVFENQVSSTPFTAAFVGGTNSMFSLPLGEDKVRWTVWLEKEALWSRLSTLSHIAVLEGDNLDEFRRTFDTALSDAEVERNEKGEIAVHGTTVLAWTSKIPE